MKSNKKIENIKDLTFSILKQRQQKNFKQTQLGTEIGLSQKQYSRIETGEVVLKLQVFLQIAHVLSINPCDLLDDSGLLKEFPPSEKSKIISKQKTEISELKERNLLLEKIMNKLSNK